MILQKTFNLIDSSYCGQDVVIDVLITPQKPTNIMIKIVIITNIHVLE